MKLHYLWRWAPLPGSTVCRWVIESVHPSKAAAAVCATRLFRAGIPKDHIAVKPSTSACPTKPPRAAS